MDRRRALSLLLTVTAVALAVAGWLVWREMSPSVAAQIARCDTGHVACFATPRYHLHPLRAEILWAAAALVGLLAAGVALRPRVRGGSSLPASG